jgi:hypothetical protein
MIWILNGATVVKRSANCCSSWAVGSTSRHSPRRLRTISGRCWSVRASPCRTRGHTSTPVDRSAPWLGEVEATKPACPERPSQRVGRSLRSILWHDKLSKWPTPGHITWLSTCMIMQRRHRPGSFIVDCRVPLQPHCARCRDLQRNSASERSWSKMRRAEWGFRRSRSPARVGPRIGRWKSGSGISGSGQTSPNCARSSQPVIRRHW